MTMTFTDLLHMPRLIPVRRLSDEHPSEFYDQRACVVAREINYAAGREFDSSRPLDFMRWEFANKNMPELAVFRGRLHQPRN